MPGTDIAYTSDVCLRARYATSGTHEFDAVSGTDEATGLLARYAVSSTDIRACDPTRGDDVEELHRVILAAGGPVRPLFAYALPMRCP
eukprot:1540138-Rhodomonas_salina.2